MLGGLENMDTRTTYMRARTLSRFATNPPTIISKLAYDYCRNSRHLPVATKAIENSKAWQLYQNVPIEFNRNPHGYVKRELMTQQMTRAHKSEAKMSSMISPNPKMSNLFKARTTNPSLHITKRQKRLLILWRLGVLPLHPYKICKVCYHIDETPDNTNIRPASRNHLSSCYNFDRRLWDPNELRHSKITHPEASRLDLWLDVLPPLPYAPDTFTTHIWHHVAEFTETMLNHTILEQDYKQTMREMGFNPLLY
jgi:hypothetical protein